MTHKEYAVGLRQIADFFERHTEIPLPHDADKFNYFMTRTKQDFAVLMRALGSCQKHYDEAFPESFSISRMFGAIKFHAIAYRADVCEQVLVGEREIPEQVIPAREAEVIPAHKEAIYEWQCTDPILSQGIHTEDNVPNGKYAPRPS